MALKSLAGPSRPSVRLSGRQADQIESMDTDDRPVSRSVSRDRSADSGSNRFDPRMRSRHDLACVYCCATGTMPIRSPAEFLAQAMETTDVPNTDGTYVLDETIRFQNGDMNQVVKMLQGLSNEVALLRDQVRAGSNGHDSTGDRAEKLWRTDARPICIDGTVRSAMFFQPPCTLTIACVTPVTKQWMLNSFPLVMQKFSLMDADRKDELRQKCIAALKVCVEMCTFRQN